MKREELEEDYNERAGICQYCGGLSKEEAEDMAQKQLTLTKLEYEALAIIRAADQLTIKDLTETQKATYRRLYKKGLVKVSECEKFILRVAQS